MLHGRKEVSFVSIIIFTLCPDALSLNGSVMIINQSSIGTLPSGVFGSLPIESIPSQGRFKRSNSPEGLRSMGTLPSQRGKNNGHW